MIYDIEERQIAKAFLDVKIPECILNNEFELAYDSMEYYEALFDYAHCILAEFELSSPFSYSLNDEGFHTFIMLIKESFKEMEFYNRTKQLLSVVEKHLR